MTNYCSAAHSHSEGTSLHLLDLMDGISLVTQRNVLSKRIVSTTGMNLLILSGVMLLAGTFISFSVLVDGNCTVFHVFSILPRIFVIFAYLL